LLFFKQCPTLLLIAIKMCSASLCV